MPNEVRYSVILGNETVYESLNEREAYSIARERDAHLLREVYRDGILIHLEKIINNPKD